MHVTPSPTHLLTRVLRVTSQEIFSGMLKPQEIAPRQRVIATVTLVVEQLVELARSLGHGDLQAFLPYTLVLSSYTAISQPISVSVTSDGDGLHSAPIDVGDPRMQQETGGFEKLHRHVSMDL